MTAASLDKPALSSLLGEDPLTSQQAWLALLPHLHPKTLFLLAATTPGLARLVNSDLAFQTLLEHHYPLSYRGLLCHEKPSECAFDRLLLRAHERAPSEGEMESLRLDVCVPTALVRPHLLMLVSSLGIATVQLRLRLFFSLSPSFLLEHMESSYDVDAVLLDPRHPVLLYVEHWKARLDLDARTLCSRLLSRPKEQQQQHQYLEHTEKVKVKPRELDVSIVYGATSNEDEESADKHGPAERMTSVTELSATERVRIASSTFRLVRPLLHKDVAAYASLTPEDLSEMGYNETTLGKKMHAIAGYNANSAWLWRPSRVRSLATQCELL